MRPLKNCHPAPGCGIQKLDWLCTGFRLRGRNDNFTYFLIFYSLMIARSRAAAIVVMFIRWYQRTLSPDHGFLRRLSPTGGRCRFYPSCSEYARQAIERQGFRRGIISALARLGRCHPWSQGGYDPVDS